MRHAMSEGIGFARACSRNDEEWRRALAAILDGATVFGIQSSQVGRGHRAEENRIRDPTSKHGLLDIANGAPAALDCGRTMTRVQKESSPSLSHGIQESARAILRFAFILVGSPSCQRQWISWTPAMRSTSTSAAGPQHCGPQ